MASLVGPGLGRPPHVPCMGHEGAGHGPRGRSGRSSRCAPAREGPLLLVVGVGGPPRDVGRVVVKVEGGGVLVGVLLGDVDASCPCCSPRQGHVDAAVQHPRRHDGGVHVRVEAVEVPSDPVAPEVGRVVVHGVAVHVALSSVASASQVSEGDQPQHQAGSPEPAESPSTSSWTCSMVVCAPVVIGELFKLDLGLGWRPRWAPGWRAPLGLLGRKAARSCRSESAAIVLGAQTAPVAPLLALGRSVNRLDGEALLGVKRWPAPFRVWAGSP